jgi:hypothetical protein
MPNDDDDSARSAHEIRVEIRELISESYVAGPDRRVVHEALSVWPQPVRISYVFANRVKASGFIGTIKHGYAKG